MNKRKRNNNKFWTIILCVLAVVMVGLITGIVVIQINRNNQVASEEGGEESGSSQSGEGSEAEDDENTVKDGEGATVPIIVDGESEEASEDGITYPNLTDDEKAQIQNQIAIANSVKDYLSTLEVDEALKYLDEQIEGTVNTDEKFSMRLLKVNVLNNAERHEEALEEINRVGNVDELSKWNKCEYYNMVAYTYECLGNLEKRNENVAQYEQAYRNIWGDFAGTN